MTLTNNQVFAYQVKHFPNTYNHEYFTAKFSPKSAKDNIHEFADRQYKATLEYMGVGANGALYFTFCKVKSSTQRFYDFSPAAKLLRFFVGDKKSKLPYEASYFAYFPSHHMILSLYNYDSFGHITASFQTYLREFLNITDVEINLIEPPVNAKELLKNTKFVNKVVIKMAIRDITKSSEQDDLNPFGTLKDYANKGTKELSFPHLRKYKRNIVQKIIGLKGKYPNAQQIVVSGDNINQDILGKTILNFPAKIQIDSQGHAEFEDFKVKVQEIFEAHKDSALSGY